MTMVEGSSDIETYCMPYSYCPPGMTTSISFNSYCATATEAVCDNVPTETPFCQCAAPEQTPVYPNAPGATAVGCE